MTDHDLGRMRSLLFLPANRLDRLQKALDSGADRVCLDLEDAVAPQGKEGARDGVRALLAQAPFAPPVILRINSPRTPDGIRDLHMLLELPPRPLVVMLPKVESPEEMRWMDQLLSSRHPGLRLQLLVESPVGIEALPGIARSTPRLEAILLGAVDLAAETGSDMGWDALLYARSRVVQATAAAGIASWDAVCIDLDNEAALLEEGRRARALGFTGKAAIHPRQVPPIHAAFTPSAEEVDRARGVVEAWEARGSGGVAQLDGRLLERPVMLQARRILAAAEGSHHV